MGLACVVQNTTVATRIHNDPTYFSSVLSSVLREQEQRFVQLLDDLGVGHSTSAAVAPPAKGNSPLPQLSDIESFAVDVENPNHFEDCLRRFEIFLVCAAPKRSEKEKTKLSTDAFAEFRKFCLPKDVTDYSYEEAVQGSVFFLVRNAPYLPTATTLCVLLGTKGKSSCT